MAEVEGALASDDPDLRVHAVERAAALLRERRGGQAPDTVDRIAAAFERALTDGTQGVRVALAAALAHLRHPSAEPLARALAQDGNAYVRRVAEATLAQAQRSQGRQLEERIDEVLATIEASGQGPRVRRLGRAYFTYTMNGVAHEVRSLLTGLRSRMRAAERELTGARKAPPKAWATFREQSERTLNLIERILGDAKELAAPAPPRTQRTSVHQLATGAIQLVRDQYAGFQGAPEVETSVQVDRNLDVDIPRHYLAQALANVVRNAFEAIAGSGAVMITAQATEHEVTVHVTDTGCGIPEEDRKIVFLAGKTTKKKSRGPLENMGMGLAVAQSKVEDVGGRIFVASSLPGQGTTMAIVLPRARPDADPGDDRGDDDEREEEEE